jgi:predicted GH43/DUF377 family glycosyl hydrolase
MDWGLGPFTKYAGNPILAPTAEGWESHALYNPTAWTDGKQVFLLYRAEGPCSFPGRNFTSRVGLATSRDGIRFERQAAPVLEPTEWYETPGGCEDPRLVCIGDTFYLTYTAYDGKVARLCMAVSPDLRSWEKWGPVFPDEAWDAYFPQAEYPQTPRGWSKSGAIIDERVGGRYWMYFGDTHIWVASSEDLRHWQIEAQPVISPRKGRFDSRLVEPGPAPVRLPEGWWLGYNSADENLRYAFAQVLIDPVDPCRVLRRSETPLLEPTRPDEQVGQVPQVVFAEGLAQLGGRWFLYYGMADSRLGVAIAPTR